MCDHATEGCVTVLKEMYDHGKERCVTIVRRDV